MRGYTEGYGGRYETIRWPVTDSQILDAVYLVQTSSKFQIGQNSHVVLKGTDTIVGFLGNDSLELCFQGNKKEEHYRIPCKHLRRIFRSV